MGHVEHCLTIILYLRECDVKNPVLDLSKKLFLFELLNVQHVELLTGTNLPSRSYAVSAVGQWTDSE